MPKQLSNYNAKDIEIFEGLYAITDCGKVYSHSRVYSNGRLHKGRWMKPQIDNFGYHRVNLTNKEGKVSRVGIHRLVALHFLTNELSHPEVNHKDEDKLNNNFDNLEWCTSQYNSEYTNAKMHKLLSPTGEVLTIYNLNKFCKENGLCNGALYQVVKGTRNSHKGYRTIGVY